MKMESILKFSTLNFHDYNKVSAFQHSIMGGGKGREIETKN